MKDFSIYFNIIDEDDPDILAINKNAKKVASMLEFEILDIVYEKGKLQTKCEKALWKAINVGLISYYTEFMDDYSFAYERVDKN